MSLKTVYQDLSLSGRATFSHNQSHQHVNYFRHKDKRNTDNCIVSGILKAKLNACVSLEVMGADLGVQLTGDVEADEQAAATLMITSRQPVAMATTPYWTSGLNSHLLAHKKPGSAHGS